MNIWTGIHSVETLLGFSHCKNEGDILNMNTLLNSSEIAGSIEVIQPPTQGMVHTLSLLGMWVHRCLKLSNKKMLKVTLRSVAGIMHALRGHYQGIFRALSGHF